MRRNNRRQWWKLAPSGWLVCNQPPIFSQVASASVVRASVWLVGRLRCNTWCLVPAPQHSRLTSFFHAFSRKLTMLLFLNVHRSLKQLNSFCEAWCDWGIDVNLAILTCWSKSTRNYLLPIPMLPLPTSRCICSTRGPVPNRSCVIKLQRHSFLKAH